MHLAGTKRIYVTYNLPLSRTSADTPSALPPLPACVHEAQHVVDLLWSMRRGGGAHLGQAHGFPAGQRGPEEGDVRITVDQHDAIE